MNARGLQRHLGSRRRLAVAGVAVIAVAVAVVASAYFTSSGSGTGTAAVGTASAVQLSSDPVGGLLPGAAATPITVHVHNPSSGNQFVDQITGSVRTDGSCAGSWFTVAPVGFAASVPAGGTSDAQSSIAMAETGTNQDACQGKTLTIDWTTGSGGSGGGGGGGGGGGAPPDLSVVPVSFTWGSDGSGSAPNGCALVHFVLTLNQVVGSDTTAVVTASDPGSFFNPPSTITVPAGQSQAIWHAGWCVSGTVTATLNGVSVNATT